MNTLQQPGSISRNYDAISPSAQSILLLKGITTIPFARQAAELVSMPGTYHPDLNLKDFAFWKRVVHFESRYWSVDQLVAPLAITNILEISSGYSLRGLDTVKRKWVHYIDTDLPDVINQKKDFIDALQEGGAGTTGHLEFVSLNALDEGRFNEIVDSFPEGPIAIVNEGLMMYFNNEEKEKLCRIIHAILKRRGGYWITGDVYVKSTLERFNRQEEDDLSELIEAQRIEDNMFESFEAAEKFFTEMGFVIDKEAEPDLSKISSLKYLVSNATATEIGELQEHKKIQVTWRLKVQGDV